MSNERTKPKSSSGSRPVADAVARALDFERSGWSWQQQQQQPQHPPPQHQAQSQYQVPPQQQQQQQPQQSQFDYAEGSPHAPAGQRGSSPPPRGPHSDAVPAGATQHELSTVFGNHRVVASHSAEDAGARKRGRDGEAVPPDPSHADVASQCEQPQLSAVSATAVVAAPQLQDLARELSATKALLATCNGDLDAQVQANVDLERRLRRVNKKHQQTAATLTQVHQALATATELSLQRIVAQSLVVPLQRLCASVAAERDHHRQSYDDATAQLARVTAELNDLKSERGDQGVYGGDAVTATPQEANVAGTP